MRASGSMAALAAVLVLSLTGCSGERGRLLARAPLAAAPQSARVVYGNGSSISSAGQSGWTTPPTGSLQDAPVPVTTGWSAPAAPPAPGPGTVVEATPWTGQAPCAPPAAPVAAPERTWSGCGLPCADGISQWHVRGVLGQAFGFGDDPIDNCLYWGADIGRTFCGCWGLDLFYRYHSGKLDRAAQGQPTKDGGSWHHVGAKFTYERPFASGSRFYGWAGVGPEYWWTEDYLNDDSGFGVFGELGVGYVISRSLRLRLGANVHGLDTDVTRELPANDGQSRWMWILAPVVQVEFDF